MGLSKIFLVRTLLLPIFSNFRSSASNVYDYDDPHLLPGRFLMVHLFEWKWEDIAKECEQYLHKYGYGAVQLSPPTEHLVQEIDGKQGKKDVPWWIRYQPTSYKLVSRSGDEKQLQDMIDRCNKVGVRVVADMAINHMAIVNQIVGENGVNSSGGSFFNSTDRHESFPSVPYLAEHFNDFRCDKDTTDDDYNHNPERVRNCRLGGLTDLNQELEHVRNAIAGLLNKLIDMGVVGFRIDATKHMWPGDLEAIMDRLHPLRKDVFGPNKKAFVVQEVIDMSSDGAIKAGEYAHLGRHTNFNYGLEVSNAVRNIEQQNYASLSDLHEGFGYGNLADHEVLTFVDNHDNQRQQRQLGIVTYKEPTIYKMATKSPEFNPDSSCKQEVGWVCEHRWPEIRHLAKFRSDVAGSAVTAIHKETHVLAFARLGKGYFAGNNDDATFTVKKKSIVAFTLKSATSPLKEPPKEDHKGWKRTVIFLKKETQPGENVFIRGGDTTKEGCDAPPSKDNKCTIPIEHVTAIDVESDVYPSTVYSAYQQWKQGDVYLDFKDGEARQGTHDGLPASGTPLIWTTNTVGNPAFSQLNADHNLGDSYWMVELLMDCSSHNTFDFKGVLNGVWENDIPSIGSDPPCSNGKNHVGRCGAVNIFKWNESACQIVDKK
ncbi:alpha amylase, catalytic domain-containing protein [Ditylenchus destructor]|nr:alpha amylase, catalytic domain-containing protein [Ditylenchus destructor]